MTSGAKDPAIGNRMINARAETLAEKPAFRAALKKRRCIIPTDGFFEWRKLGKVNQPERAVEELFRRNAVRWRTVING